MPSLNRLAHLFPILAVLSACGGDDVLSSSPKSSVTILADFHHTAIGKHLLASAPSVAAARKLFLESRDYVLARRLIEFSTRAFAVALTQEEAEIPGLSGVLVISNNSWTFDNFNPGGIRINGELELDESQAPRVPVTGTVETIPGGTAELDIVVEITGDGLVGSGTVTIDGEPYDIAAILAVVGLF